MSASSGRAVGGTEHSICRAVPGGSGITVIAFHFSLSPNLSCFRNALHSLQNSLPILRCKLISDSSSSFFLSLPPRSANPLHIETFDPPATASLLQTLSPPDPFPQVPQFHLLLEHSLNQNPWSQAEVHNSSPSTEFNVLFATLYFMPESKSVLAIRLHGSVCDRTAGVILARELVGLMKEKWEGPGVKNSEDEDVGRGMNLPIEVLVPKAKGDKPFWAHGLDLVGYSLNYKRVANLTFEDVRSIRRTELVRFQLDREHTDRLLHECRERGIKLFGAIAAAALIAANSSKQIPSGQPENYAVLTLLDCRSHLDPAPLDSHLGFYHSGILNTHSIEGRRLWDVAERCYEAFSNALKCNKHFRDMGVLNFLMCKAIENPGLTPSSSLRASCVAVFEDPVINDSQRMQEDVGLEDYIGCSSVHGFGPSIAVSDSIRDGQLDCSCVYPSPLHSRRQMHGLIVEMKKILLEGI